MKELRKRPVFLFADWHNHLFANYAIDPKVLTPFIPEGVKLDFHNGSCYISLVAFQFLNTKVFGFPAFTKRNFDEINLRFYVKRPMSRNSPLLRTATASAGQLQNLFTRAIRCLIRLFPAGELSLFVLFCDKRRCYVR